MGPHRTLQVTIAVAALASLASAQLALPKHLLNFSESPCGAGLADVARSVASIGDIDGDGLPDFAVGSPTTATAAGSSVGRVLVFSAADHSVLLSLDGDAAGDGLGNSVDGAGDVDGDGTPDLLVGVPRFGAPDGVLGEVRVLSGADGSLLLTLHAHGEDMAFGDSVSGGADIDGDGHPDIVALATGKEYYESGFVSAHSGADGSQLYKFDVGSTFGVFLADTFGDLDHDGCDEMLIGIIAEGPVWLSLRSGADGHVLKTFDDEGWGHDAGDYNGDGTEDMLFNSGELVSGRDWQTLVQLPASGTSAPLGDVDGDGAPDYALGDTVCSGTGAPGTFTASSTVRLVAAGDLDGDGRMDVLGVANPSDPSPTDPICRVLLNRPALLLAQLATPPLAPDQTRVLGSAGDIDGDGHPDLILGLAPGPIDARVISGESGATLLDIPIPADAVDFGTPVAGAGDVDADGVPDLLVGGSEFSFSQGFYGVVWVCSGSDGHVLTTLKDAQPSLFFGHAVAALGDVNGDGFDDVFVGTPSGTGGASVFTGPAGALLWKQSDSSGTQLGAAAIAAGDVDGDGFGDLFVGAPNTSVNGTAGAGAVQLLSGQDGAVLASFDSTEPLLLFGTTLARVGDLDGDGFEDCAVGSAINTFIGYAASHATVLSGTTGAHLFDWSFDEYKAAIGKVVPALAAGDVNGDGAADVVIGVRTEDAAGGLDVRSGADGGALLTAAGQKKQQLGGSVLAVDADGDGRCDAIADVSAPWPAASEIRAYALPSLAAPWTYAGHGLAGTHGLPQLTGTGDWRPGHPITLQLGGAIERAPTLLVLGLSPGLTAFKGGTLVPAPDVVLAGPSTGAAGGWQLEAHAPAAVVTSLLLQAWIPDDAAPKHFAASNGLLVEIP